MRFSVVIPCYNEEKYIEATLVSLKAQHTKASYEIVVVNNNCTDGTVAIAKQYGARVINEQEPGVCAARQAGTLAARGEIVISTDADTQFSPEWLNKIDQSFRSNPRLIAVGGPCRYYDGPWWGKAYTHFLFGWSYIYYLLVGHPFYMTATNIAFKKAVWQGYNNDIPQGGDELSLLHQLRRQGKVGFNLLNPTFTSGRRLEKGLVYNLFVTFLFYYFAGYYINTLFKRNIIGAAPAFRAQTKARLVYRFVPSSLFIGITGLAVSDNYRQLLSVLANYRQELTAVIEKIL